MELCLVQSKKQSLCIIVNRRHIGFFLIFLQIGLLSECLLSFSFNSKQLYTHIGALWTWGKKWIKETTLSFPPPETGMIIRNLTCHWELGEQKTPGWIRMNHIHQDGSELLLLWLDCPIAHRVHFGVTGLVQEVRHLPCCGCDSGLTLGTAYGPLNTARDHFWSTEPGIALSTIRCDSKPRRQNKNRKKCSLLATVIFGNNKSQ